MSDGAAPPPFDPRRAWALHPRVALRPEPFGALAYNHGNRRLVFLRSHDLVDLVRGLDQHQSADAALDASVPDPRRRSLLRRSLAGLARAEVIRER